MKTNTTIIVLLIIIIVLQIIALIALVPSLREQQKGLQLGGITNELSARPELSLRLGGNDTLGAFLTGTNGMTLYTFANDEPGKSNCYNTCAANWPPLSVTGVPVESDEGITGELGVLERTDGIRQVTYNNKPLYFYINDQNPGDATGRGVDDVWLVATP